MAFQFLCEVGKGSPLRSREFSVCGGVGTWFGWGECTGFDAVTVGSGKRAD